ncbi:MAG TPA: GNAT family N-acetyltransferase [Azospirillaceae bacterium]|nr:GNAT family N-acetyltransferase [Azospirillaceae bacterium]
MSIDTNGWANGWRAMTAADLSAVSAIAAAVHEDYPEDDAVFAERLALFPAGCRIALRDGAAVGYALTHPGVIGAPPPLNSLLGALPPQPDCYYIHDVALTAQARGLGLGRSLADHAEKLARDLGLPLLALAATPLAADYWLKLGFAEGLGGDRAAAALAAYGGGMRYLVRAVSPAPIA